MTDPISQYGRLAQADSLRTAMERTQKKSSPISEKAAPELAPSTSAARPGPDVLSLSDVAQKAMSEPEFDRNKVESIKQAIQQGQYPLDARRIAESFVAIERMIRD